MVCFRDVIKGIFVSLSEEVVERLEEVFLRADAVVAWKVVAHEILRVGLERDQIALLTDESLHYAAFLYGQDLSV